ncbi:hypothetical protein A2U01_0099682, partial [Trifolium medium]|nr:hypothetical protein [Trifolium medium]
PPHHRVQIGAGSVSFFFSGASGFSSSCSSSIFFFLEFWPSTIAPPAFPMVDAGSYGGGRSSFVSGAGGGCEGM